MVKTIAVFTRAYIWWVCIHYAIMGYLNLLIIKSFYNNFVGGGSLGAVVGGCIAPFLATANQKEFFVLRKTRNNLLPTEML